MIHRSALCIAAASLSALPAAADVLEVPAVHPTIQAAIDAATDGDEVVVAPGTYSGAGNVDLDPGGRAIAIRSVDPGDPAIVEATVIDAAGAGRGFIVQSGEGATTVIDGLTVTGGAADFGGAIRCTGASSPTVRRCRLIGNAATSGGGGISSAHTIAQFGHLVLEDCTVTGNAGGGVHTVAANATITGCVISSNAGPGVDAVYSDFYELTACTVAGNAGVGVDLGQNGTVQISRCTVSGNVSDTHAGGLRLFAGGPVELRSCVITGNSALTAGGLRAGPSFHPIAMINCTVTGNDAALSGGGLVFGACDGTITNSIVWGNTAPEAANLSLTAGFNHPAVVTVAWSDLESGPGSIEVHSEVGATSELIEGPGNIDVDPLFVDAAAGDVHLAAGSPAINAGDPSFTPEPGETDIDGDGRVFGAAVDLGADEVVPPAADVTGDGVVDVDDLVAVITAWGACPAPPASCPADLDGDGDVDVSDLIAVIMGWT